MAAARPTLFEGVARLQLDIGGHGRLEAGGELPVHRPHRARGPFEAGRDRIERCRGRSAPGDALGQQLTQRFLSGDQNLALVREVAKERALGDAGALGDLRHGRRVVSLLGEQVDGGQDESLACSRFPARHHVIIMTGLLSHHVCTVMG